MKKRFISILKYVFFLGIGIFLVWWQFDKMTLTERAQFIESLKLARYWLFIPVFILAMISHLNRAKRWRILIQPMGYQPSVSNTFYSIMCGYFVNTFVPRAGEVLRCSLLTRYEKIPMNKLIGTVLIERVFDLVCYGILILITILIQIKYVSSFVKQKLQAVLSTKTGTPFWIKLLALSVIVVLLIWFIKWVFNKFAHHRYIITLKGFHVGIKEGLATIAKLRNRGWFIFHTVSMWTMYLLQIYVGFFALSATEHLGIPQAFSVLSLATLAMIVSPGGIGAFPLAVKEVLVIYAVSEADSLSSGWLIWGASTAIIIIVGLLSFGILVYKNKYIHEAKQANITEAV